MKKKMLSMLTALAILLTCVCISDFRPMTAYAENAAMQSRVAALVNHVRIINGKQPLKYSPQLTRISNVRAQEIVTKFSHTRPDGTSYKTLYDSNGLSYTAWGENIAMGDELGGMSTPEGVMEAWMNSSGHRTNILEDGFEYIGVGVYEVDGMYYWVQNFGSGNLDGTVVTLSQDAGKVTNADSSTTTTTTAKPTTTTTTKKKTTTTTKKKTTTTTKKKTTTTTAKKKTTTAAKPTTTVATTEPTTTTTTTVATTDATTETTNPSADGSGAGENVTDTQPDGTETESLGFWAWLWKVICDFFRGLFKN